MSQMTDPASHTSFIEPILVFCGAAAIAVPLFMRIGLGSIIGYLVAGVAIGPWGLQLISEPDAIRGIAEFGVVLLLFIIGLELKISSLWSMRRDIFGLGAAQLLLCGAALAAGAWFAGYGPKEAIVAGMALGLSATAIALGILGERGETRAPYGKRAFAVLLFQDLSIVPILAIVPLMANVTSASPPPPSAQLMSIGIALGGVLAIVLAGRYLLNPIFRILAASGAREVMTAAALLVALGAAVLMERVGLSMAMGAFLAGVLLAESNFRHQLEADIEPFRGLLLGLFFMSVGMSINLGLVGENAVALALAAIAMVAVKIGIVSGLARVSGSSWRDALRIGALLATAGEFAFVLFPTAQGLGLLTPDHAQMLISLAALSMLLAPIAAKAIDAALLRRPAHAEDEDTSDITGNGESASGGVMVIGFGRFGQVVNQVLLAGNVDVTVIDHNVERIRQAGSFGFKVYYGDGSRIDVLHAAGAGRVAVICICVDHADTATLIAELVHHEFPKARTIVRAIDREHAIALMKLPVDYQIRDTFKSALSLGGATLEILGVDHDQAVSVQEDVRKRDIARLVLQSEEGFMSGMELLHGSSIKPEPLSRPRQRSQALNAETRGLLPVVDDLENGDDDQVEKDGKGDPSLLGSRGALGI